MPAPRSKKKIKTTLIFLPLRQTEQLPKIALCSDFRALCYFEPSLTFCWSKGENALLCIRCSMNALQNTALYYTVLTTVFFGINVCRGLCEKKIGN